MSMRLSDIKNLRNKRKYDEALAGCFKLLDEFEGDVDILRLRASIYTLKGAYNEALQDYNFIIESGLAKLGDFFLATDSALLFGDYNSASGWLSEIIEYSLKEGDDAFESVSYFLLAYVRMQMCDYDMALDWLMKAEKKEPTISYPLPSEEGIASVKDLRAEIKRRKGLNR